MRITALLFGIMMTMSSAGILLAQQIPSIESYKCHEFLSDSGSPDDALKLLRPLVAVAWGTGFAAAHQQNRIRADINAMHSIAVLAGDACRKNPDKLVVEVIVSAINLIIGNTKR